MLFNIALEKVIRDSEIQTTNTIYYKSVQLLAYADDIDIVARTRTALVDAFNSLLEAAKRMGLQVNEKKTKYMISNPNRACGADDFLEIGNYKFDRFQHHSFFTHSFQHSFISYSVRPLHTFHFLNIHISNASIRFSLLRLAYASMTKESYDILKTMLRLIKYDEHKWKLYGDLKIVAMILDMQQGYNKYECFLCEWNSRDRNSHYKRKIWPECKWKVGEKNILNEKLVASEDVLLPPLHIKLGLIKQLNTSGRGFMYLSKKFPRLSAAKIKEGVFVGPQIRELQKDSDFEQCLAPKERREWPCFKNVTQNFLGRKRANVFEQLVQQK
ncbi:hypothetical protein ANN_11834 [Periplaneta americana]|uniref:Reverse transcriptase domain-containing protein n=1 Tax=Periplaneta americana TaxID=6978 RepID=A0ABQ8T652_PERAM|nr:hypothetical protein ANN_11834 [Periplaneta americana]